jgi:hypothetical protein
VNAVRHIWASIVAIGGVAAAPGPATGQMTLEGRAEIGRVEYRVRDSGILQATSGVVFGGALGLLTRDRFAVWGEARGGHLAAASVGGEDRDVAEVQLMGEACLRPWLTAQGGVNVRSYSTALARQRWTALRLGAEAHVPLALEGIRGLARAQWMPVVSVSGLDHPDIALAAGVGVEWQGTRVRIRALYTLERYDFSGSAAAQRLEEVSSLQLGAILRLHTRGPKASETPLP